MKRFLMVALFLGLFGSIVVAQTTAAHDILIVIPQISMIALSDSSTITLSVTPPGTPGDTFAGDSDATKYLRYTILNPTGVTQQVTAGITLGTVPAGLAISLATSDATPLGVMGSTTLSGVATAVITSIPSGFTGIGVVDGALLTYTLSVTDPALLEENGIGDQITVTFTILDT